MDLGSADNKRGFRAIQEYLEDRGITELMVRQLDIEINTLRSFKERHGEKYEGPDLAILFPHYNNESVELLDWACGVRFKMPSGFNPGAEIRRERWGVTGKGSRVWLHPLCDWQTMPEGGFDIDIHESVLKAALAHSLTGRHSIGLNGVNTGAPKGMLDPMLAELMHGDSVKRVRIIFDDNTKANPMVARAQDQLAGLLQEQDIDVWIHNVPDGMDDVNNMWKLHGAEYLTEWLGPENGEQGKYVGLVGELTKLNTEVVLIRNGSYIYEEETGVSMSRGEFKDVNYASRRVLVPNASGKGVMLVSAADEWLKWTGRRQVINQIFKVGAPQLVEEEYVNQWYDDSVGAKDYTGEEEELVLGFIRDQVNDDVSYAHLMNMLAWHVQNPGLPPMNYMVLVSTRGHTGKSLLLDGLYKGLFGKWAWGVSADLWHSVNTPYYLSQFVLYEEAFSDKRRGDAEKARLKSLATAETLQFNDKYAKAIQVHKGFFMAVTSNDMDALNIGKFDRRAFVVGFGERPARSGVEMAAWADEISAWLLGDKASALGKFKQMLLDWDCNGFDYRADAPVTEAKEIMMENSLAAMDLFVRDLPTLGLPYRYYTALELGQHFLSSGSGEVSSPLGLARRVAVVMSNWGYVKTKQIKLGKDSVPANGVFWDISGEKANIDLDLVRADRTRSVNKF